MSELKNIRNFAIIAHIDHGKSTLADRMIQLCGGLDAREMREQVLDSMDIERERGITIKAQTVRLLYTAKDGEQYQLNLMDTPGHVDFAYEVSRSLAACEGSILVVDASQGVEAQTLANVYQALDNNHEIIPVLNKIDLPAAEPDRVKEQIEDVIGLDASDAVMISAKTGLGIGDVLEAIVQRLPAPKGDPEPPLKALLVDSWYDPYLGVVILVRVVDGQLKVGMKMRMMASGAAREIDRVGVFTPEGAADRRAEPRRDGLHHGRHQGHHGNQGRRHHHRRQAPADEALPGFKPSVPVVFCGLFPTDAADFEHLRDSLGKLALNDASFHFEAETSAALGFGFRCGFLGLLHLEIIQERLEREFDLDLITTAPSVVYKIHLNERRGDGSAQSGRHAGPRPHRPRSRSPGSRRRSCCRTNISAACCTLHRPARRADRADLCRQPRHDGLPPAAERGGIRLLRSAEDHQPRLCQLRLPDGTSTAKAIWSSFRSWSTPSRSMRSAPSSTGRRPKNAAARCASG